MIGIFQKKEEKDKQNEWQILLKNLRKEGNILLQILFAQLRKQENYLIQIILFGWTQLIKEDLMIPIKCLLNLKNLTLELQQKMLNCG